MIKIFADLIPPTSLLFFVESPKRHGPTTSPPKRSSLESQLSEQKTGNNYETKPGADGEGAQDPDCDGGGQAYRKLRKLCRSGRGLSITADRFWDIFFGWAEDECGKNVKSRTGTNAIQIQCSVV